MTVVRAGDETCARLSDIERFALAWWGQPLAVTCRAAGLARLDSAADLPGRLASVEGAASGHLVAAMPSLLLDGLDDAGTLAVIGGPCIGDCGPFPTLEALYDVVQPIVAARALGAQALLYLGDREEMMSAGGEGRWGRLAERFEDWIARIARALDWPGVTVVRTSTPGHDAALAAAGDALAGDPAALDAAFHLGSGTPRAQDDAGRLITRRVVEAHLPGVVQRHLGLATAPTVLACENLQQAGACRLAAAAAMRQGHRLEMVAHVPAPGASAGQRMYRSEPWDKIAAWEVEHVASGSRTDVHPLTREFFACWLGTAERRALATASQGD